ncbi:MAG: hypothetical protein WCG42_03390 [Parachlamydiaceae bacterium]
MSYQLFVIFGTALADERDWSGIYGGIFHYGMIFAFTGSALLGFFYFWRKGALDWSEEAKIQMMHEEDVDGS